MNRVSMYLARGLAKIFGRMSREPALTSSIRLISSLVGTYVDLL